MRSLSLPDGRSLALPAFVPDATRAVVRGGVDAADLEAVGIEGLMVNALHLSTQPGTRLVKHVGGIHAFTGWRGAVMSDSGGYQVHSLLQGDQRLGSITDRGFTFRLHKGDKKRLLTPAKAIAKQLELGSDILFCLDDCGHPSDSPEVAAQRVDRTLAWARACKKEFEQRTGQRKGQRPLLYAVVQGGTEREQRVRCASELIDIGFDGYGFGGWPVGPGGDLVDEVHLVAELVPPEAPLHALGIGRPDSIVRALSAGYDTLDCSLPTRDARRGRVFYFTGEPSTDDPRGFYSDIDLKKDRFGAERDPIDSTCDCPTCQRYTRAYLHHLFVMEDGLGHRLATVHNLRFVTRLVDKLRVARGSRARPAPTAP